MTDNKTEISHAADTAATSSRPASAAATPSTPPPKPPSESRPAAASARKSRSTLIWALIIVCVVALLLAGALWYQQQEFRKANLALTQQIQSTASAANRANEQAQQALSQVQGQSGQLATLETSVRESKGHVQSLEQAFQTLTDSGSDLVLLNDVDHLVTIAQQQLQLGGHVGNAIISLETAQAQLARANRPALASLQQTVNGDLDRLRAASTIDVAMLSTQLDDLSNLISQASLMVPDDAAPNAVAKPQPSYVPGSAGQPRENPSNANDASWWQRSLDTARYWSDSAWSSIRRDLGQFITVRRVDDPTALLMSPDQATRFRENLRLRIMTAQLALMMHQPKVWKTETDALVKSLETRYDSKDPQTRQALKIAQQMADTRIDTKLPTVDNSLQAIESIREAQAKAAEDGAISASPNEASHDNGHDAVPAGSSTNDASSPGAGDATPGDTSQGSSAPAATQAPDVHAAPTSRQE